MLRFKPFKGKNFDATRILLLGESVYSWRQGDKLMHPDENICEQSVRFAARNLEQSARFFRQVTKAICGTLLPTPAEIERNWDDYAYAVFVQEIVGEGAGVRPTPAMYEKSKNAFSMLLEDLRPGKVVILGLDAWKNMPLDTDQFLCRDVQSYRLQSGDQVWCLALPHPANRQEGFSWKLAHESINLFRRIGFPDAGQTART